MKIRSNATSLNALRHSADNLKEVKSSIEKLSSGTRINRGADGPASLIASERMRGQIAGMRQAHSNNESAIAMFQTAEGALSEFSNILLTLKQLSVHAANDAVNDQDMLAADQQEVDNLISTLDRIVETARFNNKSLLDGSLGANGAATGDNLRFVSAETWTKDSPIEGYEVDILQVATQPFKKGNVPLTLNNIGEGVTILLSEGGRNVEIDTRMGKEKENIEEILANHKQDPSRFPAAQSSIDIRGIVMESIKEGIVESGLALEAFETPDKTFYIRHKEFGADASFSVSSNLPGFLTKQANVAEISEEGLDVAGRIGGATANGKGQYLTAIKGAAPSRGITIQYDRTIGLKEVPVKNEQGDVIGTEFVEESQEEIVGSPNSPRLEGYVHLSQQTKNVNLGPIPGMESGFSFRSIRTNNLGLGVENESGFRSLFDIDLTTKQGANDAGRIIEKVIDEISAYRASIGAFQKNVVESNLNSLKIANENLTQGESTIRDTDMAGEMSKLTGNQILLSASQSMQAQANQLPQNVLSLLQK
ncbi:MAG: flagellin [Proteobacteria bacterium]|nr:MAG: flagellin [Pseudomonadota bacterium]|tara:strand:- start:583 stop:2190 length:1608 start_codon:yes stop_codon:yes gene_type:complete